MATSDARTTTSPKSKITTYTERGPKEKLLEDYVREPQISNEISKCIEVDKKREETIWGMDNAGHIRAIFIYNPLEMLSLSDWHQECEAKLESATGYKQNDSKKKNLEDIARFEEAVRLYGESIGGIDPYSTRIKNLCKNFNQLGRASWGFKFSSKKTFEPTEAEPDAERLPSPMAQQFVNSYNKGAVKVRIFNPETKALETFTTKPTLTLADQIAFRDLLFDTTPLPSLPLANLTENISSNEEASNQDNVQQAANEVVYRDPQSLRQELIERIDDTIKGLLKKVEEWKYEHKKTNSTHHDVAIGMDQNGNYVELKPETTRERQRSAARFLDHVDDIIQILEDLRSKNNELRNQNETPLTRSLLSFVTSPNKTIKKHVYFLRG